MSEQLTTVSICWLVTDELGTAVALNYARARVLIVAQSRPRAAGNKQLRFALTSWPES